ncbi:uncharacterized protein LOC131182096 [Hevea brasiliensis]|uniref:uncharacterized protein LOC131182096 n=1 Tax=Hevea brasiliensis TaxID=3981 RepID=UPI0025CD20B7|nr:uncharacterized protein LOC131182096 [Hevea brasiliensis]
MLSGERTSCKSRVFLGLAGTLSRKGYSKGSVNIVADLFDHQRNGWNLQLVQSLFNPIQAKEILSIPIASSGFVDSLVWHFERNGRYSIRLGYKLLVNLERRVIRDDQSTNSYFFPPRLWVKTWGLQIQPKIKVFLWKAIFNALLVKENLLKQGINIDLVCSICNKAIELVEQALFLCDHVKAIWFSSPCSYKPNHAIWKERNKVVLEHKQPDPLVVSKHIAFFLMEQQQEPPLAVASQSIPMQKQFPSRWELPPVGILKLNCDTSWKLDVDLTAIAVIARNSNGILMHGIAERVYCSCPLAGEAQAMLEALRFAAAMGISSFIIKTDSATVYSAMVNSHKDVDWEIQATINLMRYLVPFFGQVHFSLVNRGANSVADIVAKLCLKNLLPCNWLVDTPAEILNFLYSDALVAL